MIRLHGNWEFGAAYDEHTTESVHIGTHENGTAKFQTKRTEMGELVYALKYRKDNSALPNIIELLGSGLIDHIQKITVAAMQIADMKLSAHRS